MLVEDATAFIEQIEVLKDDKQSTKQRRRVAQAELEVLEAQRDVRLAADALGQMEQTLARGVESVSSGRRLFRRRGAGSLEREIETVRAHLAARRNELTAKQERLNSVEQSVRERDAARRSATVFRLHSGPHHLDCSAARFERLSASQLELPVHVARKDSKGWWWYLDRFWWGDGELTAIDVEELVLRLDLHRKQKSDAAAQARVKLLGEARAPLTDEAVSAAVRLAVWRRDRGRCVDCGSGGKVVFDRIVPISQGGSDTEVNVELRCQSCCVRLARNEMRTRVNRARVEAAPLYRDERVSA